ncbi:DUF7079 family protein [Pseudomonas frederiksbergensis]|jgi:hypothetical protein|uniref:DUF7079 domain-containing protein n=1 Tax=Pseudomonas frederiksbergensis TaxID=104087 RepID=A0A0B1YVI6_9PSED|nr:hypothetical protein [Pseudomonas frederiksbergensis]KHK61197.1 hypothetical protein JZ00_29950 [Pseudomonas frederiksbergensis]WRV70762.1 hypothetical protein VQ575_12230 [Pseudomonas frederiksbergensis]
MGGQLDQRELWLALSYLFVDNEVDYVQIAAVAKSYSMVDVEDALFKMVAPVCIFNFFVSVPPIWFCFDREQLFSDIDSLIEKRAKQGPLGKCFTAVGERVLRFLGSDDWAELKAEIERANQKWG